MTNCVTGGGELEFYKSNNITACSLLLVMRNKLWYLEQGVTSMGHRAQIRFSSDTFVRAITGSTLHKLWHYRLCRAGKLVTDHLDEVADSVSFLRKRNFFFSCLNCSKGKITSRMWGYNKTPDRETIPGGRFHMEYWFVRGKHTKNSTTDLLQQARKATTSTC